MADINLFEFGSKIGKRAYEGFEDTGIALQACFWDRIPVPAFHGWSSEHCSDMLNEAQFQLRFGQTFLIKDALRANLCKPLHQNLLPLGLLPGFPFPNVNGHSCTELLMQSKQKNDG